MEKEIKKLRRDARFRRFERLSKADRVAQLCDAVQTWAGARPRRQRKALKVVAEVRRYEAGEIDWERLIELIIEYLPVIIQLILLIFG